MNRQARRLRPLLPFLLICLAGAATALLQAVWLGLAIPPTGVLLLVAGNIFCIWGLWHWRRLMPLLPAPPWRSMLRLRRPRETRSPRRIARARWTLVELRLRQMLAPPPPQPKPRRLQPAVSRRQARSIHDKPVRVHRRLPLPNLAIEFVAPGRPLRLPASTHEIQGGVLALVQDALQQALPAPPPVVALVDGPRQLTCQVATHPMLTGAQQRTVVAALQVHGFSARWDDEVVLRLSRETIVASLPRANVRHVPVLWVPVGRTRQGQVWWPLPRRQHLLLAGNPQGPLFGLLQRLALLPEADRSRILLHDGERRLIELHDVLASLPAHAGALSEARQMQLAHHFAQERGVRAKIGPCPVLVVYAPDEQLWPDVFPLLAPESGVQVILVLGDREPLAALRAVCHRLPVVEVPDPRFPPLPDAFRPGGLPPARPGQAVAWLPGGTTFWRGLAPGDAPTSATSYEVS